MTFTKPPLHHFSFTAIVDTFMIRTVSTPKLSLPTMPCPAPVLFAKLAPLRSMALQTTFLSARMGVAVETPFASIVAIKHFAVVRAAKR
jgi:hypothetical protein